MTSKLLWITAAAVILVAAAMGAWMIFGGAPAEVTPPAPKWTAIMGMIGNVGIENVYFMDATKNYSLTQNLSGHENILKYQGTPVVFTASGQTKDIPYNVPFDIVVAIRVPAENVAYLAKENIKLEFSATGGITITPDNTTVEELFVFENQPGVLLRLNARLDPQMRNLVLSAGSTFSWTAKLWLWV